MNRRRAADIEALKLAFFENAGRPFAVAPLGSRTAAIVEGPVVDLTVAAASLRRAAPADSERKIKAG
ncbi:MAG: hypothetical protein DI565_17445 [Ancylobacter novellus]|uniref:Uncharacterized protein n=1 Tax=Ancylobacter novellus TaxID=921 RepID=A0A2W5K5A1_ANCNO|nr:MAG: hypothetical protein DI565_17445 [Ancylobacter novellus]